MAAGVDAAAEAPGADIRVGAGAAVAAGGMVGGVVAAGVGAGTARVSAAEAGDLRVAAGVGLTGGDDLGVAAGGGLTGAADGTGLAGTLVAAGRATVLRAGVVFLVTGAGWAAFAVPLGVPVAVPVVFLLAAPDAVPAAGTFFVAVFLVMIGFSSAMADQTPPRAGYTGLNPSLPTA